MARQDCLNVGLLVARVENIPDSIPRSATGIGYMHIRWLGWQTAPVGWREPRLLMGKGYKPAKMSNWECRWVKRSGELREPIAENHGYEATAGLGRRPPNPRWGPHFRDGEVEVADVYEDESDEVYDHAWLGAETLDDVLALE